MGRMRFQDWMSGKSAVRIGLWIGQHMPRWAGYGVARLVAGYVACYKPPVYWKVRANLRHIFDPEMDDVAQHKVAQRVFYHAGQAYYDFFRALGQPLDVLAEAVHVLGSPIELMRSEMAAGRGVLLLGAHMGNLNLALLTLAARRLPAHLLSYEGPNEGFAVLNRLREMDGFEVTAVTPEGLRKAIRRLKSGGLVITGADRPVVRDGELIEFCGRSSFLPGGPARMAYTSGATVFLGACYRDAERGYVLDISGPIEMARSDNRRADVAANARRLATVIEGYVRARPEQWLMFHHVWPEAAANEQMGK